ncbi:hypothetical protein AAMO2058_000291300 [Amorphochlora amoebiformis]
MATRRVSTPTLPAFPPPKYQEVHLAEGAAFAARARACHWTPLRGRGRRLLVTFAVVMVQAIGVTHLRMLGRGGRRGGEKGFEGAVESRDGRESEMRRGLKSSPNPPPSAPEVPYLSEPHPTRKRTFSRPPPASNNPTSVSALPSSHASINESDIAHLYPFRAQPKPRILKTAGMGGREGEGEKGGEERIPRLIHQTWKTNDLGKFGKNVEAWKSTCASYEHKFYNDSMIYDWFQQYFPNHVHVWIYQCIYLYYFYVYISIYMSAS